MLCVIGIDISTLNKTYLIFDISPRFIPLPSDGFLFDLLEPWDVRALSIMKTADLLLQLRVGTFHGYLILFSIRNPYINRFTNHFSIH